MFARRSPMFRRCRRSTNTTRWCTKLKAVQAALTPKVQDLREVAEWQQWANVGIQEQLCEKMEALADVDDPEAIATRIHELQQQWRQAADVPRAQGEALWRRFKAVHDELWARCEAHFAAQASARAENLAKKVALCERAEALADSTNWLQTAEAIKGLQAEWKTIGPVTRGQEKAIWERFRAACDRFFTRRQDDLAKRKALWAENFAKKEALCLAVEALAGSTDWEPAAAEISRLQTEWKTIGPVKKSRSEAIWQRFRAACDAFFVRYAQRHDIARAERVAAREAICAEIEALAAPPRRRPEAQELPEPPAGLAATVRGLRSRWQQELAARGVDRDQAVALDRRFAAAFARDHRRDGRRRSPAPTSTPTQPQADGSAREADGRPRRIAERRRAGGRGACRRRPGSPRCSKKRWRPIRSAGKSTSRAAAAPHRKMCRQAQASWSRIGPVAEDAKRAACRSISARGQSIAQGG